MFKLKIRKFGMSLGVILPREVVNRLRTSAGERVFLIEAENRDYRLTSYDPAFEKKLMQAESIMKRYRNALDAPAR